VAGMAAYRGIRHVGHKGSINNAAEFQLGGE